ncbi:hypothetical protein [Epibacterium sp. Ofav1-8]|uniref:hypothetical protein n=1 Tax=Epibacterium sp. Ofav1-8 TaxID=2917735 RepID=UPI001EF54E39|nr:hypothetical protein [Epibacterium sp. Ofav1-8]MCG7624944.1 hypothetical protein [Epibacterium sp. Ofav1-8]
MTTVLNTQAALGRRSGVRTLLRRIRERFGVRKPAPAVRIPEQDLRRLAETSPHLLADIGVQPATSGKDQLPWRLEDGRQLVLRSPL